VAALLRSVVHAGDALQREQAGERGRDLPIEAGRLTSVDKAHPRLHVMIIEEGHEVAARLPMRTHDVLLHVPAVIEHAGHGGRGSHAFDHPRQGAEEWKVEGRVDAYEVAAFAGQPLAFWVKCCAIGVASRLTCPRATICRSSSTTSPGENAQTHCASWRDGSKPGDVMPQEGIAGGSDRAPLPGFGLTACYRCTVGIP
jgi:hypothetical protein